MLLSMFTVLTGGREIKFMNNALLAKKKYYESRGVTKETKYGYFSDGYRQFNDKDFEDWLKAAPSEEENNEYKKDRSHQGKRLPEFPDIRDQLDIIYKTFKHLQSSGIDLGEEGRQWIQKIDLIKQKYPKASEPEPLKPVEPPTGATTSS